MFARLLLAGAPGDVGRLFLNVLMMPTPNWSVACWSLRRSPTLKEPPSQRAGPPRACMHACAPHRTTPHHAAPHRTAPQADPAHDHVEGPPAVVPFMEVVLAVHGVPFENRGAFFQNGSPGAGT
jgi:hypothetical protein